MGGPCIQEIWEGEGSKIHPSPPQGWGCATPQVHLTPGVLQVLGAQEGPRNLTRTHTNRDIYFCQFTHSFCVSLKNKSPEETQLKYYNYWQWSICFYRLPFKKMQIGAFLAFQSARLPPAGMEIFALVNFVVLISYFPLFSPFFPTITLTPRPWHRVPFAGFVFSLG